MARNKNRRRKSSVKRSIFITAACVVVLCVVFVFAWQTLQSKDLGSNIEQGTVPIAGSSADDLMRVTGGEGELLDYPGFWVSFNANAHQPNWVAWELTREEATMKGASRKDSNFLPDGNVKGCAELADYKGSGVDRGHMCPAADMKWSKAAMDACHLLTNICPQTHELNAGAWKKLEEKCRDWAIRDSAIVIVCGPILTDRLTRTIGPNRVPVPERFFKVVLAPYVDKPRAIGFIMNNGHVDGGMQAAAVSVDEVERVTGYDFFSALPDDIEDVIEAECNFPRWSQKGKK